MNRSRPTSGPTEFLLFQRSQVRVLILVGGLIVVLVAGLMEVVLGAIYHWSPGSGLVIFGVPAAVGLVGIGFLGLLSIRPVPYRLVVSEGRVTYEGRAALGRRKVTFSLPMSNVEFEGPVSKESARIALGRNDSGQARRLLVPLDVYRQLNPPVA